MKYRKLLATGLVTVMMMGMAVTSFAAGPGNMRGFDPRPEMEHEDFGESVDEDDLESDDLEDEDETEDGLDEQEDSDDEEESQESGQDSSDQAFPPSDGMMGGPGVPGQDMQAPPEKPEGDEGQQPPEKPEGDEGQQPPENPEGDEGQQPPEKPEGDEGQQPPEKPEGDEGQQPPEKPEGDEGQQPPEKPVGDEGQQPPEKPQGDGEQLPPQMNNAPGQMQVPAQLPSQDGQQTGSLMQQPGQPQQPGSSMQQPGQPQQMEPQMGAQMNGEFTPSQDMGRQSGSGPQNGAMGMIPNDLLVDGKVVKLTWNDENEKNVTVDLTSQKAVGDISVEEGSVLVLNIASGSAYTGSINTKGEKGQVSVVLAEDATWTLTGDTYVSSFDGDISCVTLSGHTLYVNGEAYTG